VVVNAVTGCGNKKANNYSELVEDLLLSYLTLGCKMRIKVQYLPSHLSEFPKYFGHICEEKGGRSHKDISDGRTLTKPLELQHDGRLRLEFDERRTKRRS